VRHRPSAQRQQRNVQLGRLGRKAWVSEVVMGMNLQWMKVWRGAGGSDAHARHRAQAGRDEPSMRILIEALALVHADKPSLRARLAPSTVYNFDHRKCAISIAVDSRVHHDPTGSDPVKACLIPRYACGIRDQVFNHDGRGTPIPRDLTANTRIHWPATISRKSEERPLRSCIYHASQVTRDPMVQL
jgi:hypothetical protein